MAKYFKSHGSKFGHHGHAKHDSDGMGVKLKGTNGDNVLVGSDLNDWIFGRKGDDILDGGAGNDFLFGGKGNDQLDGGAGNDKVLGGKGDDFANFTLSENLGAHDIYDGGKGFDTLQLTLTSAELQQADVQADLAAFEAFLARTANTHGDDCRTFQFQSFDLDVRNFEALKIVTIGGNTAPVAIPDSATVDEDSDVTIDALLNDTDVDGDQLTLISATVPAGFGSATIIGDQIVYNPGGDFQYLAAGEPANVTIDYTIADAHGAEASSVINVVVTGLNDAPVAVDDDLNSLIASRIVGPIHVAVVGGSIYSSYEAAAAQLADSTVFDFAVTAILDNPSIDWATELVNFDVVVLGGAGLGDDYGDTMLFSALHEFVDAGHGVITTGWFLEFVPQLPGTVQADADYISPVANDGFLTADLGSTIAILQDHPITHGVTSYVVNAGSHELATAINGGATSLANPAGTTSGLPAAIAYEDFGATGGGRTAYLGSLYMANDFYGTENLRTVGGDADKIFEQAVAWAAGDRAATVTIDDALLLANDDDVDSGDVLAIDIDSFPTTSLNGAAISFDANGDIVYALAPAGLEQLLAGNSVTDSFDYTISDGNGGFDTASVNLTIAGLNDTVL